MTFRVVRTNQYNQDLGLIHSTNGNHLESPNEGGSIDHQVTIHLHAQNITMFPTNETWYFASQMLVSSSNHLESPNEGGSIDHQVTIHLHAQNITMFPTNETWYFASQMLVSSSGGLILILTDQSTRNEFIIHSDY
ncbi:u-box domain/leucine-rich repeat protein [Dorcoceras hygrometricum]|uniref:U-box domain/leucine-rich repeat protein n=1 Tax=Dorcoceras hygrometricum TaxID=472368 RepID=A0A2Z7AWW9_9LAMI|nr:u-box domain/leucine-rich repeat protein [Dorcoceras hygrometricum]